MVNFRMLGLASALLLLLPVAAWANPNDPSSYVVEGGAEGLLQVTDVALADLGAPRAIDPSSTHAQERLVEGHTVFAVIDITTHVLNDTGNFTVDGLVSCSAHAEGPTRGITLPFVGKVYYPTRVDDVTVDCLEQHRVVVIPSPFQTSSSYTPLHPTGVVTRYQTPNGDVGYEEEYAFFEQWSDAEGVHQAPRYAWAVSAHPAWTKADGHAKNLMAPLPADRLHEMGLHGFQLVDERQVSFA